MQIRTRPMSLSHQVITLHDAVLLRPVTFYALLRFIQQNLLVDHANPGALRSKNHGIFNADGKIHAEAAPRALPLPRHHCPSILPRKLPTLILLRALPRRPSHHTAQPFNHTSSRHPRKQTPSHQAQLPQQREILYAENIVNRFKNHGN